VLRANRLQVDAFSCLTRSGMTKMQTHAASRRPSSGRFLRSQVRFEQGHRGSRVLVAKLWKDQVRNNVLTKISNVAPIGRRKNPDGTRNFCDLMSCKTSPINPPAHPD
jgi:hypothetical protein